MLIKRSLLASSALAVLASASQAQAGDFYVNISGGGNFQGHDKSGFQQIGGGPFFGTTGYTLDSDAGFVLGGALGVHLDQWLRGLRLEVEASFRRNEVNGTWFVTTLSTQQGGIIDANESSFAVLANVWYDIDVGQRWVPYIGGGAGWARTKVNGAFLTTFTTNNSATYGHAFNVENSGFAYQLGAGIKYAIQDGVHFGIGYRFFKGPQVKNDIFIGKHNLPVDFDNENHSVTVDLTIDVN